MAAGQKLQVMHWLVAVSRAKVISKSLIGLQSKRLILLGQLADDVVVQDNVSYTPAI
jgi:hypothetical protein